MTPERWFRIKQIANACLDTPSERWGAQIAEACTDDVSLAEEVRSLLASHAEMGDFMASPVLEQPEELLTGRQIGNYQVRERIAEGGMGTVYRAVRASDFEKQVAIKLVKRGMDTDFILRRFRHERQILAGLDHPNIAHLLDGGATEDGRPYLVMEYIEGKRITEYSDEHALGVPGRLRLFRTVCSAVQYAHQNLVVHRDLKPANILVTEEGVAKLMDFGIAKILDPERDESGAELTLTNLRVLTPDFASPEQVRGDAITTASDIYSLGVILYLLLTGRCPYRVKSNSLQEIVKAVCETEPEKPSVSALRLRDDAPSTGERSSAQRASHEEDAPKKETFRRGLSKDLDFIVLKALRKEPHRRYATVEQFSEDVRRYLDNLPVIARQDTLGYRTSKFVVRHKAGVAAALAITVILLAGILITWREARIAQRRFNDVRELANSLVFDLHDSIKDLPGATHAREVLVQKATQYLDRLERDSDKDPSLQRELAGAYERLGNVEGRTLGANLGDSTRALKSYRKAQSIEERLAATGLTQDRLRYAQTGRSIATILWATSDTINALKTAQTSLAITQALSKREPDNPGVLAELGADYVLVGDLMTTTNSNSSVPDSTNQMIEDHYRRALEIDQKLASGSSDPRRSRSLAMDELYIGRHFNDTGRWQEAVAAFNDALAVLQRSADSSSNNAQARRDLATIHNNLGDAFLMSGNASQSLSHYEEALRLVTANALADPADSDSQALVAEAEMNVGNAIGKMGKGPDALGHLRLSIRSFAAAAQGDPKNQAVRRDLAIGYFWSARILANSDDSVTALSEYHKAIAMQKEIVRADPADLDNQDVLAGILASLGDFFQKRGQLSSAEENYHEALSMGESLLAKAPDKSEMRYVLAQAYLGLARAQMSRGSKSSKPIEERVSQWKSARSFLERSSSAFRQIHHPAAVTMNGLDAVDESDIRQAISQCDASLAKFTLLTSPTH